MKRWDGLVDSYISSLSTRSLSPVYIENTETLLYEFGVWLKRKNPRPKLEDIDLDLVTEFLNKKTKHKVKATVATVLSRLRCMCDYIVEQGYWHSNPLRWFHGPKVCSYRSMTTALTKSQVTNIYKECFSCFHNYNNYLFPAIFSTLYSTGMRRGELVALNLSDWNSTEKYFVVKTLKRDEIRTVPVPNLTAEIIEVYLAKRNQVLITKKKENEVSLFVGRDGQRINGNNILISLKKVARKVGVQNFSLHMLRHTCTTDLIASGVSIPQVQRIIGHACIESTFRYTHVSTPERKKAMELHPINSLLGDAI